MRCASCGTENAPDSRFCGGCGARLGVSGQRLAPTQKISDDASFPAPRPATAGTGHAGHAGAQPGAAPRLVPAPYVPSGPVPQQSLPPPRAINNAPPGVYPTSPAPRPPNGSTRQPPLRPPTQLDDPSMSMPMVARRPWGLIVFVLLLDLGLGIAGAWMLREGLDDEPGATDAAPRSEASATLPSAVAAGAQGAPIEPPTAPASTGAVTAPETGSADPAPAGSATPGAGAAAATSGSTTPGTGATAGSAPPATGAADPSPGAAPATGSDAATADKPARRHRTTVKKPTGAAPTGGPVDPYAPTAPRPDPLPRESK
jgi:hypothetical protein